MMDSSHKLLNSHRKPRFYLVKGRWYIHSSWLISSMSYNIWLEYLEELQRKYDEKIFYAQDSPPCPAYQPICLSSADENFLRSILDFLKLVCRK